MALAVSDWSTNPALNTTVGGVSIAEGCPAANINNAERQIMAEAKAKFDAIDAATTGGAALAAIGALTPAADKVPYFTGTTTAALASFTAFGRSLAAAANAGAANTLLGALSVTASSLGVNGYINFNVGGTVLILQWGRYYGTYGEGQYYIPFNTPFPTACWHVLTDAGAFANNNNDIGVQFLDGSESTTTFGVQVQRYTGTSAYLTSIGWLAIGG